ncbi:MAG: radical SAM family heme chaperone HemW [Bacteroidales bacterium]|nr:radical SAM family heme chaperone HemW [Bacteroidales bacterium]
MNGIYIHVPFCLSKCGYCDFYSITRTIDKSRYIKSIVKEIILRSDYLIDNKIDTIYFGGGTPSLLKADQLKTILDALKGYFLVEPEHEITLEANPDDLSPPILESFRALGINRISIGIQSFDDGHLQLMNRRHNATQAVNTVLQAHQAGFERISIDLIYGIPGMSSESWNSNLLQAVSLPIGHISSYHLSIEPGTPFDQYRKRGRIKEVTENESVDQYYSLIKHLAEHGFEMYEISNFARRGEYSKHNLKYWQGGQYLGLGPSAHSYNGKQRHWNPRSLFRYYEMIEQNKQPEGEEIDLLTARNELVMTRLRTKWGLKQEEMVELFGMEEWNRLLAAAEPFLRSGDLQLIENNQLIFNKTGWFRSDGILTRLFRV